MKIIKLNAINSTNTYLVNLAKTNDLEDETLVVAKKQTQGRGQLGAVWHAIPEQSLTFSVFKKFSKLQIDELPNITYAVSIGVYKALKELQIPHLTVKWPNDIMSHSKKIAGILIENQLKQGVVIASIIGIGININQEKFENLPQATSMLLSSGNKYILEEVLNKVSNAILKELKKVEDGKFKLLKEIYEASLFKKNVISVFENKQGIRFNGKIKGITDEGRLLVEDENNQLSVYELKEIKMLF